MASGFEAHARVGAGDDDGLGGEEVRGVFDRGAELAAQVFAGETEAHFKGGGWWLGWRLEVGGWRLEVGKEEVF